MVDNLKKCGKTLGIFLAIVLSVLILLAGIGYLIASSYFRSAAKIELEYYNKLLPNNEIVIPFDMADYKSFYRSNWYFDSLTDKVQEKRRYEDFWVHEKNYDILFCSDKNFLTQGTA